MDVTLNLDTPDELDAFATFCTTIAEKRRERAGRREDVVGGIARFIYGDGEGPLWRSASAAETATANVAEPLAQQDEVEFPPEPVEATEGAKKRRGRKPKEQAVELYVSAEEIIAESGPEPEPDPQPTDEPAAGIPVTEENQEVSAEPKTVDDLRAAFTRIYAKARDELDEDGKVKRQARQVGQDAIMAILTKYKAKKASDVAAEDIGAAVADANEWVEAV